MTALIPAAPLLGALILAFGRRLGPRAVAFISVFSVALAAGVAAVAPEGTQVLWTWIDVAGFRPRIALRLDGLSHVMTLVVTGVGTLILLYSAEFMADDEGYRRFFAYMDLFVGAMLVLVLADDLVLLLLGWEGVGLASYLLIGFWWRDPRNGWAARKAFVVTRIGDTALLLALFVLWHGLGTLEIQPLLQRAALAWPTSSASAVLVAALVLGGAVGKSAQIPLQTWLPDAMAGPTPVSALIHAATMVTAGVYLIARLQPLFLLAPAVMDAVALVGAVTLLVAGVSACVQTDIKRVLAYSTVSQLGLMFVALGAGAWTAAIFHLVTHAFFKALLFLGAGAVTHALHHEHDLRKMGGLRKRLPLVFWTFTAGAASLAGLPLVTAGFWSKDAILAGTDGTLLAAGLAGALLTAAYSTRLVLRIFFGPVATLPSHHPGLRMTVPLALLAALALFGGALELPLSRSFAGGEGAHVPVAGVAALFTTLGVFAAWLAWRVPLRESALLRFWREGWGFDRLYDASIVHPFERVARALRGDPFDAPWRAVGRLAAAAHAALHRTQTGLMRRYLAAVAVGAVLLMALGLLA